MASPFIPVGGSCMASSSEKGAFSEKQVLLHRTGKGASAADEVVLRQNRSQTFFLSLMASWNRLGRNMHSEKPTAM